MIKTDAAYLFRIEEGLLQMNDKDLTFHGIYDGYYEKIHRYLEGMVGRNDADDLAQEVFIKVYYALEKFKFQSGFGTWLYRIAVNHFKDYLRKHAKERHISIERMGREVPSSLSEDEIKKKERAQETADRKKLLYKALRSLPEKHQVILTLRDIQGHSYEEIAGINHCHICDVGLSPDRLDRG